MGEGGKHRNLGSKEKSNLHSQTQACKNIKHKGSQTTFWEKSAFGRKMLWQADFSSKSKHALGLRSTTLRTALAWASAIPLVAVPLLWLPNIEEIQISPLCGTLTAAGDQPICYRENYRFAQRIPGRTTLQRACESLLVFPLVLPPALKNSWKGARSGWLHSEPHHCAAIGFWGILCQKPCPWNLETCIAFYA